jgi:GT2 family glycosyltransferase
LILFLNNDTMVLHEDWLHRMVQWFDLKDVGSVGAKLLYPDGTLQHAGVIVGLGGIADHLFAGQPEHLSTIFGSDGWYRNLSAVTAACMLVSRKAFNDVDGFDEGYTLNYSDVDLCMKIRDQGWRIVYTPDVRLIHYEHKSHNRNVPRSDFTYSSRRFRETHFLDRDPYFNCNLSYMSTYPIFNKSKSDHPLELNRRLLSRLPKKSMLQLPDDLR